MKSSQSTRMARQLIMVVLLIGVMLAPQSSPTVAQAAPLSVEFQAPAQDGTLATCTLSLNAPTRSGSNVKAYAKVTCSAVVSSIRLVVELAKRPNGNTGSGTVCQRYDNTLYNKSWHEGWALCYYSSGYQWQSRASGYAPGWSNYKQSSWVSF